MREPSGGENAARIKAPHRLKPMTSPCVSNRSLWLSVPDNRTGIRVETRLKRRLSIIARALATVLPPGPKSQG